MVAGVLRYQRHFFSALTDSGEVLHLGDNGTNTVNVGASDLAPTG